MAFVGEITDIRELRGRSEWEIDISYYDESAPEVRFPRTLRLPLSLSKAEIVVAIRRQGQFVRGEVNTRFDNVIGTKVTVP